MISQNSNSVRRLTWESICINAWKKGHFSHAKEPGLFLPAKKYELKSEAAVKREAIIKKKGNRYEKNKL